MPWLPGLAKPDFCDWLNALFRDRWRWRWPSEGKSRLLRSAGIPLKAFGNWRAKKPNRSCRHRNFCTDVAA